MFGLNQLLKVTQLFLSHDIKQIQNSGVIYLEIRGIVMFPQHVEKNAIVEAIVGAFRIHNENLPLPRMRNSIDPVLSWESRLSVGTFFTPTDWYLLFRHAAFIYSCLRNARTP